MTAKETTVEQLADSPAPVRLSGVLSQVTRRTTKQGRMWVSAKLTDATGTVEALVYPSGFDPGGEVFVEGAQVTLSGRACQSVCGPEIYLLIDDVEGGAQ